MELDQREIPYVNGPSGGRSERMIVASNRLPISLNQRADGNWEAIPASGGLVHALKYVLEGRGGKWFGWPGVAGADGIDRALEDATAETNYRLQGVPLTEEQVDNYYFGFSNEVIWPLFHDMVSLCNFWPEFWDSYRQVNEVFARNIASNTQDNDFIWVQDYHLMLVSHYLRAMGSRRRTAFFLHIPFPPLDIYLKLPWRFQILRGLLEFDTVGFQTVRDTRNFIQCVRSMLKGVRVSRSDDMYTVTVEGRNVSVGNFPIGIDFNEFDGKARSAAVADATRKLRANLPNRQLILGIDRLDYTKGIPERLYAYQNALRRYPDLIEKTSMIQVVVPSREIVSGYRSKKEEVERLVSEINGEFTTPGWVPVHYLFRSLDQAELISYYRGSDISLVTPIKDGMNLICKEYVASNVDENGALILSEFAGSAAQLHSGAILVNPHDVVGTADAIYRAFTMPAAERRLRMRTMRRTVSQTDVFWWTNAFLSLALEGEHQLRPAQSFYVPSTDIHDSAPRSHLMVNQRHNGPPRPRR